MDRAIEAINAGDSDTARRLCDEMKGEWLMLHDLMAESVLGLSTFVQERLGDEGVAEAWESCCERGWRRHHDTISALDRLASSTCSPPLGGRTRARGWARSQARSRSRRTRRS
jgi:hypothetical protein